MRQQLLGLLLLGLLLFGCSQAATETPATPEPSPTPAPTATTAPATEPPASSPSTEDETVLPQPEMPDLDLDLETTASGLQYALGDNCTSDRPQEGDVVTVHYTGSFADGTTFDSSYDRGEPLQFPLGQGFVIPGWDEGLGLMSVGCEATLVIPPELGYGQAGFAGVIPPNSTLVFEVTLVDARAGAPATPPDTVETDYTTTDSGLQYVDLEEGEGQSPEAGWLVTVDYTGWLADGGKFASSFDTGEPVSFVIGRGLVIPGWDEGVMSMNIGGTRLLRIPPELGYGDQGAGEVIPPNTTIILEVTLRDARPGAAETPPEVDESTYEQTESGLEYIDLEVGSGETPEAGQFVSVHYTGWLTDGTKFDSSLDRGRPFEFQLGTGSVIPGWDEGVSTMQVGGKRLLRIPPDLGYGDQGAGDAIPPGATLIFEVELLEVE